MIRINLLPARKSQRTQFIHQQLLAFAGLIVATIIACIVWVAYNSNQVSEREAQVQEKQKELAHLDKIIGEVNEFTAKKKELEEKLQIIETLKKGKTGPVRALDDLATEIPNRVWLKAMEEKGGQVTFEGTAIEHEDVSAFMKALQKSKYFRNIQLGFSKESSQGGNKLYEFKITCGVNYAA